MAEIDRIKALAGLLDNDDEDDLFESSSNEGDVDSAIAPRSDGHTSSSNTPSDMPVKQPKKTASVDQLRHGVLTNQQQDNILMEMRQKKMVTLQSENSSGQKTNNVTAAAVPAKFPIRPKLGQPRLTLTIETNIPPEDEITDESSSPENDGDQLIFGRPKTFGAAGGYSETYMPNVKERAKAISTWKVLEMKKERKNGHARAREWAVREEGIIDYSYEYEESEGHDENVASNGQYEQKIDKGNIPTFLAQFDHDDVENDCENSVNGVASPTPRSGDKRVPLSPRSMNVNDVVLSPKNWVSRNIGLGPANNNSRRVSPGGIGVSPINVLSPRTPRNKVFSRRDQVLSPRSNALLSQSRAVNRSINQVKLGVPSKVTASHKPPMSPRGFMSNTNSIPTGHDYENQEKEMRPLPAQKEVKHATPPVKFNGVEVMGELAAALERRLAKSGAPESSIPEEDVGNENDEHVTVSHEVPEVNQPNKIGEQKSGNYEVVTVNQTVTHRVKDLKANQASTKRVTFNHRQGVKAIGELATNLERKIADGGVPGSEVMGELAYALEYQHAKGGALKSNGSDLEHDGIGLSESEVIGIHKSNVSQTDQEQEVPVKQVDVALPVDKTIQDTLDEASQFLQTAEVEEQLGDSGCIESKIDDELSAAAELARELEKFLVEPVSSIEDKRDRAQLDYSAFTNEMGVDATTHYLDKSQTCAPGPHSEEDDMSRCAEAEVETQSRNLNEWNKVKQNTTNDSLGFPSNFGGLSSSHLDAADINKSNNDDEPFVDAFQSLQIVPKKSPHKETKAREKNLPKIKMYLKIEGAPQLDIDKNADDESMFYMGQAPSPSCGDDAGLLQTQHSSGSPQKSESPTLFVTPKKRGVALNSPTKKRLNNLGLKLGLINAGPSNNDLDSPSMDNLLKLTDGQDENIGMISNGQLRQLTPSNQESGHFFASPPSPIMHGSLMSESSTNNKTNTSQADFSASRKKMATRVLKRISTPLKLGRRMGRAGVNDDVFYGEV